MSATRAKATGSTPENQASRLSLIPPTPLSKGLVIDFFVLGDLRHVGQSAELPLKLARQQPLRTNALTFLITDQCQLIRITDIHRATGKSPGRPCLRRPLFWPSTNYAQTCHPLPPPSLRQGLGLRKSKFPQFYPLFSYL